MAAIGPAKTGLGTRLRVWYPLDGFRMSRPVGRSLPGIPPDRFRNTHMLTTTYHDMHATMTRGHAPMAADADAELVARYQRLLKSKYFPWTVHYHFQRRLGSGGQGMVYLTEHRGADGFTVPVAVKMFAPERYDDARGYDEAMDADRPRVRARRPDPAGQPAVRAEFRRSRPDPHDADGVGRRLRSPPPVGQGNAGSRQGPRQHSPLGVHQQRHRHGRTGADAVQTGRRGRDRAGML